MYYDCKEKLVKNYPKTKKRVKGDEIWPNFVYLGKLAIKKKERIIIIFKVKNFHFTCESHQDAKILIKFSATQVSNKSPLNKDLVIWIIN
jgi:hypothetical protein